MNTFSAGLLSRPAGPDETVEADPAASRTNVAEPERVVSVAAGAILTAFGLARRSGVGALIAGVGGAMLHRGLTGHCYLYESLGIDTARPAGIEAGTPEDIAARGIHVEHACLINRPASELYGFWRNFENLPRFMRFLESVNRIDELRSHWATRAPAIAGGRLEWDARITRDERDSLIAWQSLAGSGLEAAGEVHFRAAPGDRGTEVHVVMDYVPPAGRLGHWAAALFGHSPERQIREDLRNFKRLMECGEIPTIEGQPRGTCLGRGSQEGGDGRRRDRRR
jgi:uncharacterized membrane protein